VDVSQLRLFAAGPQPVELKRHRHPELIRILRASARIIFRNEIGHNPAFVKDGKIPQGQRDKRQRPRMTFARFSIALGAIKLRFKRFKLTMRKPPKAINKGCTVFEKIGLKSSVARGVIP
jgi:hypothetical protein